MGDSMTRYTSERRFAEERGGAGRCTPVFTVLMEEAGKHVRANEDATTLTDIARDMNHVPVQQKVEKRGSSSSRRPQR